MHTALCDVKTSRQYLVHQLLLGDEGAIYRSENMVNTVNTLRQGGVKLLCNITVKKHTQTVNIIVVRETKIENKS